jgi:hypothetical protein
MVPFPGWSLTENDGDKPSQASMAPSMLVSTCANAAMWEHPDPCAMGTYLRQSSGTNSVVLSPKPSSPSFSGARVSVHQK